MAVGTRLVSLFTLSSLAVLICSLTASPAAAASLEISHNNARSLHHRGHDALAKRKRAAKTSKRCKPKAAPAPAPTSTKKASKPAPTSSGDNKGNTTSNSGNNGNNGNNDGGVHINPGPIGGNSKMALAWANGDQYIDQWAGAKTMYTWSPACPAEAAKKGIDCCPMAWGWNQVDQFQKTVNAKTPKCAMGPNEPEIPSQSNMSPQSAAQLWNQYIRPLAAKGTTLITPACTSDPAGKQWMKDFFAACGGNDNCGATYYATHYYDVTPEGMIAYLEDLHDTFHMDIWVTEFACQSFTPKPQCTKDQVWHFQSTMTDFFNKTPWINKVAPWGAMHELQGVNPLNSLMNADGSLNALGHAYMGF